MYLNFLKIFLLIIVFLIWLYLLSVCKRAKVNSLRFFLGSIGTFLIGIIFIKPYAVIFLNYILTSFVGIFGNATGLFKTLYSMSAIFVNTDIGGLLLQIDVECSGIIEIIAFISLILFFDVYNIYEKLVYSMIGVFYIIIANAIRIITISLIVYCFGYDSYNIAHSYIGRILFYLLSISMYFYVFTKPQINSMKVGNFNYQ